MPTPRPNTRSPKPKSAFMRRAANETLTRSMYATTYKRNTNGSKRQATRRRARTPTSGMSDVTGMTWSFRSDHPQLFLNSVPRVYLPRPPARLVIVAAHLLLLNCTDRYLGNAKQQSVADDLYSQRLH